MRFPIAVALAVFVLCAAGAARAQDVVTGRLQFTPAGGTIGTRVVARAAGLAPNAAFVLLWRSADPHWRTESGKFYGIASSESTRVLARGTSDASGAWRTSFTVPADFGYMHDVEVHAANEMPGARFAATQGFTVVPQLTISPSSGPPGTPITITATGLGYRFYQIVWHLLYDGAQTGWISALTTHGTARITIPATGAIGMHTLQAIEGPTAPYLNGQQSPNAIRYIPQVIAATFRVTAGPARTTPPARLQTPARRRSTGAATDAALSLDYASGPAGAPLTVTGRGFGAGEPVVLTWETYVGNRLSGNGWTTEERPLGRTAANPDGSFVLHVKTPDDLGGPHRVIARGNGVQAAAGYHIVPSVAEIEPRVVAPGGTYTVHITGVGWTETANTYTVVLDNGDIGYGCGFNSQGDVTMRLRAPGARGTHYLDLYPTIYTGNLNGPGAPPPGASVNGIYFLLPMLNVPDHPGEALPAFHLSFVVR